MKDKGKTKEQLINELAELRQRALELEKSEAERKRAEQEAQEAREYAESIIETVREPLIVLDSYLRVKTASRAFYKVFKVSPEEIKGKFIYDLGNRQWDIPKLRKLLEEIIPMNNQFQDFEVEHEFPGIGRKTMLLNSRRIYREDIGTQAILLAIEDITERKRADEALKNYAAELEEANRLKDLFTDIMRHDLLNPLGIIKTATEQILFTETKDERAYNTLLMIKRNAEKLIDMIKSASMYAMLESAEKLERSKLDLSKIFREVANNFKPQLEEKNMKLEYTSKGECYVIANPMIDAVFSNLLSNTIKYSPAGNKIEVSIIDEKEHCKIYVKDWGYGIKDEDKAKLFTRFQRVNKKGVKGTGLGLAIVKRVVDLHGGKVWIEDNPEGGSVFYVEIPKA